MPEVLEAVDRLTTTLQLELERARSARRLRDGFQVAILGPPNAGKSSLINYLAGRDAAIVSETPGTTRDIIEVRYDLRGLPVTFLDTAGLRRSVDPLEQIGIARALERADLADLRVFLCPADLNGDGEEDDVRDGCDLVVFSKADLAPDNEGFSVSVVDGSGVQEFLDAVHARLDALVDDGGVLANLRHEKCVQECLARLKEVEPDFFAQSPEIVSEGLRSAARSLEMIVGRIEAEAVFDVVFGSFCLGK